MPLVPTRIEVFHFKAPINEPIVTSFGSIPARNALLVRIEDKTGAFGWGEVWANFPPAGFKKTDTTTAIALVASFKRQ